MSGVYLLGCGLEFVGCWLGGGGGGCGWLVRVVVGGSVVIC